MIPHHAPGQPANPAPTSPWLYATLGIAFGCLVSATAALFASSLGVVALVALVAQDGANSESPDVPVTQSQEIAVGNSSSGHLSEDEAHEWLFHGYAGDKVVIDVIGHGDTDPHAALYDPCGDEIGYDDDGGGSLNAQLDMTLPVDGWYTLIVEVYSGGEYTLRIDTADPKSSSVRDKLRFTMTVGARRGDA